MPEDDKMAKARQAKARAAEQATRSTERKMAAQVQTILDGKANYELKAKLQYCQEQISSGRKEQALIDRRRELIREAQR